MTGAGVHDGDMVIIRQQATAADGDIVAATIGAETTLKRFRRRGERAFLAAENPAIADIEIVDDELVVHGVAVGLLRRLSCSRKSQRARAR
jgi:repressor LexA